MGLFCPIPAFDALVSPTKTLSASPRLGDNLLTPEAVYKAWVHATQIPEKHEKGPSKTESLAAMNAQLVEENDRLAAHVEALEARIENLIARIKELEGDA